MFLFLSIGPPAEKVKEKFVECVLPRESDSPRETSPFHFGGGGGAFVADSPAAKPEKIKDSWINRFKPRKNKRCLFILDLLY
jgi:hypothetical protein